MLKRGYDFQEGAVADEARVRENVPSAVSVSGSDRSFEVDKHVVPWEAVVNGTRSAACQILADGAIAAVTAVCTNYF